MANRLQTKMQETQAQAAENESNSITAETYIRADSDRQFGGVVTMAGGVNRFFHFRRSTPLDLQNVVRMNRDTLYSMAVVDTSQGATITVPPLPAGRYASVYLVDNDHYCPGVIDASGTHALPRDTKYLGIGLRLQVFNPADPEEIALVNQLQDQFQLQAGSADPLPPLAWDRASLQALTSRYGQEATRHLPQRRRHLHGVLRFTRGLR
jgi:hypothetical protein